MEIIEGEYKGHPMIVFKENDKYLFSLGFWKLRLIIKHLDVLKKIIRYED